MTTTPRTPAEIIGTHLTTGTKNLDRALSMADLSTEVWKLTVSVGVEAFTIVALLAELDRVAPDRARQVAAQLAVAWDDGDSVHELMHDWTEAHAKGQPVGFEPDATLDLEVTR